MEIDNEIVAMAILLIQKGLLSVISESIGTEYWLTPKSKLAQEKSMARLTDHLDMTIAGDWNVKPQTKQKNIII